jgi:hypothetical protein
MIGIYAILMEAGFVLLGFGLAATAAWGLFARRRGKPINTLSKKDVDDTYGLIGLMIFGIMFFGFLTNRVLREVRFHSELSRLRAEVVDRIEVGNQIVTDRGQIAEIVQILNSPEWFSLRRGDAADKVSIVIRLTSGQRYHYEATRYQHGEGAALVSHSPGGWDNGEVLCRKLPASLAKAGVTLPPCYTYFGQAQHCAMQ